MNRWVLSATCLMACFDPRPPQGAPCAEGDRCPAGLVCRDQVCVSSDRPQPELDAADADDAPVLDASQDAAVDAVPDAPGLSCPTGYMMIAGQTSRYRTELTQRTWLEAEQDCEDDGVGTHLTTIESASEQTAVDALTGASIWFGLSDRAVEGTERWVTGATPTFMHVVDVDNTGAYDCAGIYQSEWAWGDCSTLIEYVCECDGIAADPNAY